MQWERSWNFKTGIHSVNTLLIVQLSEENESILFPKNIRLAQNIFFWANLNSYKKKMYYTFLLSYLCSTTRTFWQFILFIPGMCDLNPIELAWQKVKDFPHKITWISSKWHQKCCKRKLGYFQQSCKYYRRCLLEQRCYRWNCYKSGRWQQWWQ